MSVKVIKPGIFSTVQDLGRVGYRDVGIGPGGVMDSFAASVANYLVDNKAQSPVIEMHFPAAEFLFETDALISITGGDFRPSINDVPVDLWKPIHVKKEDRLSFKKYVSGARAYLAIQGGMAAEDWLNSFSTHTKVKTGGYEGRPLQKEDQISFTATEVTSIEKFPDLSDVIQSFNQPEDELRVIAGPEWELVSNSSKALFSTSSFSITTHSDRMGFRLKGAALELEQPVELISSAVDFGCIQLLPSGQLIVLMADHQTTGGYPRIANVISADFPTLAQSPIHHPLRFKIIDLANATDALISMHQTLENVQTNCKQFYELYRPQL